MVTQAEHITRSAEVWVKDVIVCEKKCCCFTDSYLDDILDSKNQTEQHLNVIRPNF